MSYLPEGGAYKEESRRGEPSRYKFTKQKTISYYSKALFISHIPGNIVHTVISYINIFSVDIH